MKPIVIALSDLDGREWVEANGFWEWRNHGRRLTVLIVTPRSIHRTRGVTATAVYMTEAADRGLSSDQRDALLGAVVPCLYPAPRPLVAPRPAVDFR